MLYLSSPDAESSQSPKEASPISSTAKSPVVLQKGAGKRPAEEIGENKKMKVNRGRPWMDDSEGRVIHTAGKTLFADKQINRNQDGCFRVG